MPGVRGCSLLALGLAQPWVLPSGLLVERSSQLGGENGERPALEETPALHLASPPSHGRTLVVIIIGARVDDLVHLSRRHSVGLWLLVAASGPHLDDVDLSIRKGKARIPQDSLQAIAVIRELCLTGIKPRVGGNHATVYAGKVQVNLERSEVAPDAFHFTRELVECGAGPTGRCDGC
jgi:hypothetical protein